MVKIKELPRYDGLHILAMLMMRTLALAVLCGIIFRVFLRVSGLTITILHIAIMCT